MLKKFTKAESRKLGKLYKIDFDVVPFDEWHAGLCIELEHWGLTYLTELEARLRSRFPTTPGRGLMSPKFLCVLT